MRNKIILFFLSSFLLGLILSLGSSAASATTALQPFQQTATPESTELPEPEIATVAPAPTEEIDPAALILDDAWQNPINLSRSGATSNPQLVTDSSGVIHILWLDEVEGYGYTVNSGDQWDEPEAGEFPFYTRRYYPDLRDSEPTPRFRPILAADGRGQLYAFWIDDNEILYYSSVPAGEFLNYDSWTPRTALTDGLLSINATTGADGSIHLVYIRQEDSATQPAGVYYQKLNAVGSWGNPILLFASRYMRSIPADETNLQIVTQGSGNVYVAWDDTLREQVYLAGSTTDGASWDFVQEIDRRTPDDAENAVGPSNIIIGASNEQLHLSWVGGHEEGQPCSQYVSVSDDGGTTWSLRDALSSLPSCFTSAQFLVADGTLLLLGSIVEEGADSESVIPTSYLLAWDGERWSDPQFQEPLASFTNPETNQSVHLDCHYALGAGGEILLLGCDTAQGGDSWLLRRPVGTIEEWFPPPPVWQGPVEISGAEAKPLFTELVSGSDGSIHNFWIDENSPWIFHASWDGERWGSAQEIVSSPANDIISLAATSGSGRLFLTWEDSAVGIQFSQASLANPSQWSDPVSLLEAQPSASSPSILADEGGNVFLAFVEQLNEARGIYFIHSADAGDTWSAPLQVFDGPSAGWDMVDRPILTRTDNGHMHLMWWRRSLPPNSNPIALAYSRSEDLGQTWSEAEVVVEAQTYWADILGAGERFVHRLWSEADGGRDGVWHSYSLDGGLTWSQSEQVLRFLNRDGLAATVDPAGRLQLLTLAEGQLANLVWQDEEWREEAGLQTGLQDNGNLAASVSLAGELFLSYVEFLDTAEASAAESRLYAMWRQLDLPEELSAPLPSLTPTQPASTATPTVIAEPTATIVFSTEQEPSGLGDIPGLAGFPINLDLLLAFLPVLLIVGIGLVVGLRIIRKR